MSAPMDLCIFSSDDKNNDSANVKMAIQLGYETVAFSHFVTDLKSSAGKAKDKKNMIPSGTDVKLGAAAVAQLTANGQKLRQISRLTALVQDARQTHKLTTDKDIQSYDILAIQPTSEQTFQVCCSSLDIDLISMDFSESLPFLLKRGAINVALERGIHFEIMYRPMIQDSGKRKAIISNALLLCSLCHGKNIIISSGCRKPMDLRGPYDVANLGLLFGLTQAQCKDTVTKNCRSLLLHAESRKSMRSSLSVINIASMPASDQWVHRECQKVNQQSSTESDSETENPSPKKRKKQRLPSPKQNKKVKS